ncbi:unnamed protein product, partial [Ectocarpus sp. 8 AP-2014]
MPPPRRLRGGRGRPLARGLPRWLRARRRAAALGRRLVAVGDQVQRGSRCPRARVAQHRPPPPLPPPARTSTVFWTTRPGAAGRRTAT